MLSKNKIPITVYKKILEETSKLEFDQTSDLDTCILLATLAATKNNGRFLELGTGTGLSTSYLLSGMDCLSTLITVDNNKILVDIAKKYLKKDKRVKYIIDDGENILNQLPKNFFDFIFADTWPGKYFCLDETLSLLKKGGIYFIDDMHPQENWPIGHEDKVKELLDYLYHRNDFLVSEIDFSSGVIVCTRIK